MGKPRDWIELGLIVFVIAMVGFGIYALWILPMNEEVGRGILINQQAQDCYRVRSEMARRCIASGEWSEYLCVAMAAREEDCGRP